MGNSNFKNICLIFLCMLLCVSCQSKPISVNATTTETNLIEVSETNIYPRPTTTRGPNATPAPTRKPTVTPTATLTPNPTWVSMLSTETYFMGQVIGTRQALISSNPFLDDCFDVLASFNKIMLACRGLDGVKVYKSSALQITIIPKDIYPNPIFPNSEILIVPLRWSNDNTVLYFTATTCCRDGPGLLGGNVYNGLWRLNTKNNSINNIIKNADEFVSSFYFSISSTERRLIYIDQFENPLNINILDIKENTTDKIIIEDKFESAAGALWSEDGTQIIFVALSGDNSAFTPEARTSLFWLDVTSLEMKELIVDSTYMLTPQSWGSNNIITLRAETGTDYVATDGSYWYYDLNNNQLLSEKP